MKQFLKSQESELYFIELMDKVSKEYEIHEVYPPKEQLFACFDMDVSDLKVVIIGQDPYHQKGQANGLAFSVNRGVKIPPSLKNIYKEMEDDLGIHTPDHGDWSHLVKEGVLLLNNVLSVVDSKPNSHKNLGWDQFMIRTLEYIDTLKQPIVFILWGSNAISKKKYIKNENRLVIESVHPSPLSSYRGFFGSKPFSKANDYLKQYGKNVNWGNFYE